jgi:DNA polymerase III epsilon subunit-like protein
MKVLVFDTETTGLPSERNPSIMESEKWPYVVQLSYILYDMDENKVILKADDVIRIGDDVNLTDESVAIHGITREKCNEEGITIGMALVKFNIALKYADLIVGHNISFDKRLIMVECNRNNIWQGFTTKGTKKPEYCTMKNTVEICKLEKRATSVDTGSKSPYKYPRLGELYCYLFQCEPPKGLHNSMVDVITCLRCYIKLESGLDILTIGQVKTLFEEYGI